MNPRDAVAAQRPIIFAADQVRAILDGQKTQTRRLIREPSMEEVAYVRWAYKNSWYFGVITEDGQQCDTHLGMPCPYGRVHDRLWVREPFAEMPPLDELDERPRMSINMEGMPVQSAEGESITCSVIYRADGEWEFNEEETWPPAFQTRQRSIWRSSMAMPRKYSRLLLRITEVRAERVQEISLADAELEGVTLDSRRFNAKHRRRSARDASENPPIIEVFREVWDKTHARLGHGWDTNPWVWALTFEIVDPKQLETPATRMFGSSQAQHL